VQPAAEGVGVAELDRDHLEAELVELFGLPDLARLDADGLGVEHQHVHRQPDLASARDPRRDRALVIAV